MPGGHATRELDADALPRNVPAELLWLAADGADIASPAFESSAEGAGLHLRISGLGAADGENAARWLSLCCETVHGHGGDVVELTGERLVAIWREESLRTATLRATCCGEAVLSKTSPWCDEAGVKVRLVAAVGAGQLGVKALRDHRGRGYVALLGAGLQNAIRSAERARAGELVVSEQCAELLGPAASMVQRADGGARVTAIRQRRPIEQLHEPAVYGAWSPLADFARVAETDAMQHRSPCSMLAVRLPALSREGDLARVQRVFAVVTRQLAELGAMIVDVVMAADGMTICAAMAGSDADESRLAALTVLATEAFVPAPRGARAACSFGVCSGSGQWVQLGGVRTTRLWLSDCGAAALQLAGAADAACLCDEPTAARAAEWLRFEDAGKWLPSGGLVEARLHRPVGRLPRLPVQAAPPRDELASPLWQLAAELPGSARSAIMIVPARIEAPSDTASRVMEDLARADLRVMPAQLRPGDRLRPQEPWSRWAPGVPDVQTALAAMERRMRLEAMLQPPALVLVSAEWLSAAGWALARKLVQEVGGMAVIAIVGEQTELDDAVSWWSGGGEALPDGRLLKVIGQLQERTLDAAVHGLEQEGNAGDALDAAAALALAWAGHSDAVALTEAAMRCDWSADGKASYARRQLVLGDAFAAMGQEGAARAAFRAGVKALGQEGLRARAASTANHVLHRISDRFRSPFAALAASPEEQRLLDTLLDRLT